MAEKDLSRRDFLKGAGVAGASIAAMGGLAACAQQPTSAASASAAEEASASAQASAAEASAAEAAPAAAASPAADISWDKEVDTLVVGSGTAAWGALAAKDAGDENVLIIDKANRFGGTTSYSGAALWVPCSYVEEEEGIEDSYEDALTYMKSAAIGDYGLGGHADPEIMEQYLHDANEWLEWARDKYGFAWHLHFGGVMQDYTQAQGHRGKGRSLDLEIVESYKNIKGEDYEVTNPRALMGPATWELLKVVLDEQGVETMLETTAKHLVQDESGAVIGVQCEDASGNPFNIKATKVIMGTGGFDHNREMRERWLRVPMFNSTLTLENTGDGHAMALEIGAQLDNMSSYYGAPVYLNEGMPAEGELKNYMITEHPWRSSPGSIAVNKKGRRVGNECMPYATWARVYETYDPSTFDLVNLPIYIIGDQDYADRYTFPFETEIGSIPDWVIVADSIDELCEKTGIDPVGLKDELERFNGYAETGVDLDFHRGEFDHDKISMAPAVGRDDLPNPLLGPVAKPPFYCATFWPGLHGTSGGMKVNKNAQVLDMEGNVIPGLYAAGCCSSAVSGPCYLGGGTPVGTGSVRAYVAGKHKA